MNFSKKLKVVLYFEGMQRTQFTRIAEEELVFEDGRPVCGSVAFGRVVQARYRGGLVAVRSILFGKLSPQLQAMLERDVGAVASPRHPNLVHLYGICFHADGVVSLVEQLAECDLVDFLQAMGGGGLALDHVYKLGLDIARGLHFMHSNSLGHSELTPASVLLCRGTAMLTGLGQSHVQNALPCAFKGRMWECSSALSNLPCPYSLPTAHFTLLSIHGITRRQCSGGTVLHAPREHGPQ